MGPGLSMLSILTWIDYFFPSLTVYTETIGPLVVVMFGIVSVFSDILPKPGYSFPIPDIEDLEVELMSVHRLIFFFSKIARRITLVVNKITNSNSYRGFYKGTKVISKMVGYLRLAKSVSKLQTIAPPDPFVPKSTPEIKLPASKA